MKKRILCTIMVITALIGTMSIPVFAKDISVKLNGSDIYFDVAPQIINDRTMVPMRAIFEALGYSVEWNDRTQEIKASSSESTITMTANNHTFYKNGTAYTSDTAPTIINGRTLVPLRAISETLGCDVYWDNDNKTVYISTSGSPSLTGNEAIELVKKEINKGEVISLDSIEKLKLKYSFSDRGTYYIVNATATAYADGTIKYKVYKSNKALEYLGQGSDWSWSEYDF